MSCVELKYNKKVVMSIGESSVVYLCAEPEGTLLRHRWLGGYNNGHVCKILIVTRTEQEAMGLIKLEK